MPKKIVPVVIAIIKNGDKYLLTKRSQWDSEDKGLQKNPWQFPGGGIEFGESPQQALVREVKEETDLIIKDYVLLPQIFHETRNNWHGMFICFLCSLKNPNQKIILNEEASHYGWYTLQNMSSLALLPKTLEAAKLAATLNI
jgi:8-oxo-dGTP diphosphatase